MFTLIFVQITITTDIYLLHKTEKVPHNLIYATNKFV